MNGLETIAFGTLWCVLLTLGALVLLLYRQVDRSYAAALTGARGALSLGAITPEIEIVRGTTITGWRLPDDDKVRVVAFLSTSCQACERLARTLAKRSDELPQTVALIVGEDRGEFHALSSGVEKIWIAHPPEAVRAFGVTTYPLVYVLRGRTVLASKNVTTAGGVERLLRQARSNEGERLVTSAGIVDAPADSTSAVTSAG
jgi:hypothetical protein